ncbi:MAG: hypothetical protein JWQ43_2607 [Glaciihabitans sp.]|nr:hypothetical protein [Glaciihabitans sp.]
MSEPWLESWFWPAVAIVIGLPIVLIIVSEFASALDRARNPAAKVVRLFRTVVLPLGALLLLVSQVDDLSLEVNTTRIVATVFGFVLILFLLNSVNIALFATASRGSWRARLPSIFVDIARLILIVVSLGVLFAAVWGADVGGLFTALGVSSIVIGLALQNAAGSVVSGLLLLFEQPFQLGDWLETSGSRGRVVEVNWRAVHIDTGNGIQIVPTATLAGSSFVNLSRVRGSFHATTVLTFSTDDAPHHVIDTVRRAADTLPTLAPGERARVVYAGGGKYDVAIPIARPGDESETIALMLTRLWYSSRREGIHLDNDLTDDYRTPERLAAAVNFAIPILHLTKNIADELLNDAVLERYGRGEAMQYLGEIPSGLRIIVSGVAVLSTPSNNAGASGEIPFAQISNGDVFGLSAYTREGADSSCAAISDVTVLVLPVEILDRLIRMNPALARDIGESSDNRLVQAKSAIAQRLGLSVQ